MGRRTRRHPLHRWTSSYSRPSSNAADRLDAVIRDAQPPCWPTLVADAAATARFRGEHHDFTSRFDALVQVLRLCWVTEAFFAQVCYRARTELRNRGVPVLPVLLHHLSVVSGQITIGDRVVIGPGLYVPHGQIVVDGMTLLGEEVVLRPFVTLGLRDGDPIGPTLGSRVRVGTGAKVFGPVTVGDGSLIGANAVVRCDVPAGAKAMGVPARVHLSE